MEHQDLVNPNQAMAIYSGANLTDCCGDGSLASSLKKLSTSLWAWTPPTKYGWHWRQHTRTTPRRERVPPHSAAHLPSERTLDTAHRSSPKLQDSVQWSGLNRTSSSRQDEGVLSTLGSVPTMNPSPRQCLSHPCLPTLKSSHFCKGMKSDTISMILPLTLLSMASEMVL